MSKMYKHPIEKNKFITKEEYFKLLDSKTYEKHLDNFNKPL